MLGRLAALYAGCLKEYSIALLYINQLHHIEDHRDLAVFVHVAVVFGHCDLAVSIHKNILDKVDTRTEL